MDKSLVNKIQSNPNYIELVSKRSSFQIKLSVFVLVLFYSFILTIAFNKELLGTKLSEDAVMTWAFPVGAAIIVISFITTLIYVNRANGEFEDLTDAIREDVKDDLCDY